MHPTLSLGLPLALFSLLVSASNHLEGCPAHNLPPNRKEPSTKPIRSGNTGDVLKVTRCYCTDPDPAAKRWGYYLQADYFNYHNEHTYQARYTCVGSTGKHAHVPHC